MGSIDEQLQQVMRGFDPTAEAYLRMALMWVQGGNEATPIASVILAMAEIRKQTYATRLWRALKNKLQAVGSGMGTAIGLTMTVLAALGLVSSGVGAGVVVSVGVLTVVLALTYGHIKSKVSTIEVSSLNLFDEDLYLAHPKRSEFTLSLFTTLFARHDIIATVSEDGRVAIFTWISETPLDEGRPQAVGKTYLVPVLVAAINDPVMLLAMDYAAADSGGTFYFHWTGQIIQRGVPYWQSLSNSVGGPGDKRVAEQKRVINVSQAVKRPVRGIKTAFFGTRGIAKLVQVQLYSSFPDPSKLYEKAFNKAFPPGTGETPIADVFIGRCWTMAYGASTSQKEVDKAVENKNNKWADFEDIRVAPKSIKMTILKLIGTVASVDLNYTRLSFRVLSYMDGNTPVRLGHVAKRKSEDTDRLSPLDLREHRTPARVAAGDKNNGMGDGTFIRAYCNPNGAGHNLVHWGGQGHSGLLPHLPGHHGGQQSPRVRKDKVQKVEKYRAAAAVAKQGQEPWPLAKPGAKLASFMGWNADDVTTVLVDIMRGSPTALDYANAGEGRLQALMVALLSMAYSMSDVHYAEGELALRGTDDIDQTFKQMTLDSDLTLVDYELAFLRDADITSLITTIVNENMAVERRAHRFTAVKNKLVAAGGAARALYNRSGEHVATLSVVPLDHMEHNGASGAEPVVQGHEEDSVASVSIPVLGGLDGNLT